MSKVFLIINNQYSLWNHSNLLIVFLETCCFVLYGMYPLPIVETSFVTVTPPLAPCPMLHAFSEPQIAGK